MTIEDVYKYLEELSDIKRDSKIIVEMFEQYISEIQANNHNFSTPKAQKLLEEMKCYRAQISKNLEKIGWDKI